MLTAPHFTYPLGMEARVELVHSGYRTRISCTHERTWANAFQLNIARQSCSHCRCFTARCSFVFWYIYGPRRGLGHYRCLDLNKAVNILKFIDSQDTLILLRSSFSAPSRVISNFSGVRFCFCENFRSVFGIFSSSDLSYERSAWLHASLPIKNGRAWSAYGD